MRNTNLSSRVISRRGFLAGASATGMISIGPFVQASQARIEAGTDIVRTSAYSANGRGAALYVADKSIDAGYVGANPRSSFLASDGRGFRLSLDQTITPFMFGAIGNANFNPEVAPITTDDTAPLQAFFDFCHTRRVESANWGGVFGVSVPVVIGGAYGEVQHDYKEAGVFEGSLVLAPISNIVGAVLTIRSRRQVTYGPIAIVGPEHHGGAGLYKNRLYDVGVLVEDKAQFQTFSTVYATLARVAGVLNKGLFPDNTFANHIENGYFLGCGSGGMIDEAFYTTSLFAKANIGDSASLNQSTILTVGDLPPELLNNYRVPVMVRIGNDYHVVRVNEDGSSAIDRSKKTIRVHPWVKPTVAVGTKVEYIYGGGFVSVGGDAGISSGKIASTLCSTGIVSAATYTGHYIATLQHNLIGFIHGSNPGNAAVGGSLTGYFEGNTIDFLWNAVLGGNAHFTLLSEHALDLAKVEYWRPITREDISVATTFRPETLLVNVGGRWSHFENQPDIDGGHGLAFVGFNRPAGEIIPLHHDNPDIRLVNVGTQFNRLFGYRARTIQITGTGSKNEPTGTLVVRPWSATQKINGGAAGGGARFSGFTAPVTVQVALDPADADNCLVSFMGGK